MFLFHFRVLGKISVNHILSDKIRPIIPNFRYFILTRQFYLFSNVVYLFYKSSNGLLFVANFSYLRGYKFLVVLLLL
jgi:hypothetical protein